MKKIVLFFLSIFSVMHTGPKQLPHAKTVAIFAPHPDDDIIGCGGAIMHHIKDGAHVTIVYMTSGEKSDQRIEPEKLASLREQEAKKAAEKLGASDLIFLHQKDSKVAQSDELIMRIIKLLRTRKPDVVYVPHEHDNHKDHQTTYHVVVKALKKLSKEQTPLLLGYEVWTPLRTVTHGVDLSSSLAKKLEALAEHKTQVIYFDYIHAVEGLDRYRGITQLHKDYAECFLHIDY